MAPAPPRYTAEIAQMMSVLGAQPDADTVRYVEDVVRSQLQDMVVAARDLAIQRGSRLLQIEDLLFLHRRDACRSARLRVFLSWRDTTRRYYGTDVDEAEGYDEIIGDALAAARSPLRAKWDALSALSDGLIDEVEDSLGDQQAAYSSDITRLQNEDELSSSLSLDDYLQYAEAREATFTWKRAKRFRDFINLGSNVEQAVLDEVTDVLGFLAFEIVKMLCERGLALKSPPETGQAAKLPPQQVNMAPPPVPLKRSRTATTEEGLSPEKTDPESASPPSKRPRLNTVSSTASVSSPPSSEFGTPYTLTSRSLGSEALPDGPFASKAASPPAAMERAPSGSVPILAPAKALPLSRKPLTVSQVDEAYCDYTAGQYKASAQVLRNFRRGWPVKRKRFTET